jgi:hypothetical protein
MTAIQPVARPNQNCVRSDHMAWAARCRGCLSELVAGRSSRGFVWPESGSG